MLEEYVLNTHFASKTNFEHGTLHILKWLKHKNIKELNLSLSFLRETPMCEMQRLIMHSYNFLCFNSHAEPFID
jgi:hypothetical protein